MVLTTPILFGCHLPQSTMFGLTPFQPSSDSEAPSRKLSLAVGSPLREAWHGDPERPSQLVKGVGAQSLVCLKAEFAVLGRPFGP